MPKPTRESLFRSGALALFLLMLAACLFLAFGHSHRHETDSLVSPTGKWTCSMCPQFILPDPGKCPKCFMDLIPLQEGASAGGSTELMLTPDAARLAGIAADVAENIEEADSDPFLAVPSSAVLRNLGRAFVFVESDDGEHLTYGLREITTGRRRGERVEVLDGLYEGEMVAVRGVFRIDSAMRILGKVSLATLPAGPLDSLDEPEPFQPAERSALDPRARGVRLDDWFRHYESIRAALAKDDVSAVDRPGTDLALVLAEAAADIDLEFETLHKRLSDDALALSDTRDIEEKRTAFERISADMVLLARRYGAPAGGLRLIFCPMAFEGVGAHWLQPGETVDNPYHGLEMPLCGWRVDDIPE